MINFTNNNIKNGYVGKDGEVSCVGWDRYRYNLNERSWKPYAPIRSALASSVENITRSGSFRTSINNGSSLTATSTDPLLSNFSSNKLMCSLVGKQPGKWYAFCDSYGSSITPDNDGIDQHITVMGNLSVTAVLAGDSTTGVYPYAGVGFDLTYNEANISQSSKVAIDISTYTGITLTYSSSQILKLCLQSQESGDGADWFYSLPSTSGAQSTVTILWSQFSQPSWAAGTQIRTIPTDRMTNVTFQYDTEQSTITFGLTSVSLKGTGSFLSQGITLDSSYEDMCLEEIDAWFDAYYVESSDNRYGRIKWLDDNHSDPLVTVSEGMGYGIKLAVIASGLGDSEKYKERIDRMLAFWNNNLDSNGLMDWQVSGFGHTVTGHGSATDADLAFAFALICAYEKFCDPSYLAEAKIMMNKIWQYDIYTTSGGNKLLAPGDAWHDYFNPSYFIPAALLTFELYDTAHDWATVYADNLALLVANQTTHACYGLPSDWCSEDGTPVIGSGTIISFGYEACRVIDNMASGYNIYYEPALLSYLETIASNSTLLDRAVGTSPVADLSLRITPTVWGTENNSLGLMSILPAFELCSAMSQSEIQDLLDICFALTDERTDYYKQAYKCVILSVMTNKCNRYATDLGSVAKQGYVIDFEPPEASSGAKRVKLIIKDSNEPVNLNPEEKTVTDLVEFTQSSTDIDEWDSSTSTLSVKKDIYYIGTELTAFALDLPSDASKSDTFEFSISIDSSATVSNFVFTGVTGWITGAPSLIAGSTYICSIRNGIGICGIVVEV